MKEIKATPTIRCAIYTRKSTEEGLDKQFNTLEAQREAGESYIRSQSHEGWVINPELYDDGGFSGGSMERPALQRLIEDIKTGAVDVVVVYKIDRLSRSLTDFAQLVEIFEEYNVSFVSVTQHFNTKDSMGRLTLNILFSFAQFEREVISERIRDKFAASKKKGMFMGGALPLGYAVDNRQLVIIPQEARLVEHIFNRYIQTQSVMAVVQELNEAGYRTKHYFSRKGKEYGGKEFNRQYVYRVLQNPIYIGKITHKDETYDGQHDGIISQEIWDKVHATLKIGSSQRRYSQTREEFFLQGLIRCGCCDSSLTPYRHPKGKKVYRYYTSTRAIHKGYKTCEIRNIPAGEIEPIVLSHIRQFIENPKAIKEARRQGFKMPVNPIGHNLGDFDSFWDGLSPTERHRIAELLIKAVVIAPDSITIDMRLDGFKTLAKRYTQGKANNDNNEF